MNNFGEEPSWQVSDFGGTFQVFVALLCIISVHLFIRACTSLSDRFLWFRVFAWAKWNNILHKFHLTGTEDANNLTGIERRLCKVEYTLHEVKEFLENLQTEMRGLKSVATEAIELPNNVCEVPVDIADTIKTLAPKLERLSSTV